jgi:outer membrane murein-binding lipoprotein Lpp
MHGARLILRLSAIVLGGLLLAGCSIEDWITGLTESETQKAVDQVDLAVAQLQNQSASWQQVIQQLEASVEGDAKTIIDTDVQNLISISSTGVEARCDADFINQRVIDDLLAIKADLLKQPRPAKTPSFCSAVPAAIDRSVVPSQVSSLQWYGYNLGINSNIQLVLQAADQSQTDVTGTALDFPSPYEMTVNLGPNGVPLSGSSQRLLVNYQGAPIASVAVIQPNPVICTSGPVTVGPQKIGPFIPPKVQNGGDNDFAGHGPQIQVSLTLSSTPTQVIAHVYMDAKETKSDWTEVQGTGDFVVYKAPPGTQIDSIASNTHSAYSYLDTGTSRFPTLPPFTAHMGTGDPVLYYSIIGDTSGDDVGRTQVQEIGLNTIVLATHQVGGCVSSFALQASLAGNYLSAATRQFATPRIAADNQLVAQAIANARVKPAH